MKIKQAHSLNLSSSPESRQHLDTLVDAKSDLKAVDISLDLSSIILTTLKEASRISPAPFLSAAAGIAVEIVGTLQRTRRNKHGFKALAEDSCELVYVIIRAHEDLGSADEMPCDLVNNLRQLVKTLTCIKTFAQTCAARNFVKAMFRSRVDAEKIQDYREKLQQSMRVFGLQSDIILRETVAKLAYRQIEMMNVLASPSGNARATIPGNMASQNTSGDVVAMNMVLPVGNKRKRRAVAAMVVICVCVAGIAMLLYRVFGVQ